MEARGPLDRIMDERMFADLDELAMIEFGRVVARMPEVDFSANERAMFILGFATCLVAIKREEAEG